MKKSIHFLPMKTSITAVILGALLTLASCGGGDKSSDDSSTKPQSMVQDQPKDNGQGIGKFKDITLAAIDENLAKQGKVVFEAKCTACHRTTDQKIVGPGLKGVTQRRQPAWILNMITNPQEMTQKDPTAKDLLATHLTQMTFQDVSDDQAKLILEYLRENDHEAKEGKEEAKK